MKSQIFISPWGARLFVCSNIYTLMKTFKDIKNSANYVKGASMKDVLNSIVER